MLIQIQTLSPRKEEILREAGKLFAEKGYQAASMRDLAQRLGIQAASIYSNFDNKESLLWEVALRCAQAFFEEVENIYSSKVAIDNKLEQMMDAHWDVMIENLMYSDIFFKEWKNLGDERKKSYAKIQHDYELMFVKVIEAGKKKAIFQNIPADFAAKYLLSSMNGLVKWHNSINKINKTKIKYYQKEILLKGLFSINN